MKEKNTLPIKAVVAAVFCNILFGSAFPAIKIGYEAFGIGDDVFMKILFAGIRFFLSGIIVLLITGAKMHCFPAVERRSIPDIFCVAFFYTFLQYIFFYVGLSNTSGASGSIVNSASVFITVVLAHFLYRDDKLNGRKVLGAVLGFGGVLFATLANDRMNGFSFRGEGFILIAATCYCVGSVFIKRAGRLLESFTITTWNLLIGGALLMALGVAGSGQSLKVTGFGLAVLLYLCLISSVGVTIWSDLMRKYPLGKISVYSFVIPVSGTILSAMLLHENILKWQYLLALVLVCAGIVIVNRRPSGGV